MDKELKAIVRRELVMDMIQADLSQEQMESYLKSDLSKLPSEWSGDQGDGPSEKVMDEFLDERFPKEEGEGE